MGSLFFNRTLKQFLECQELASAKGVAITEKIRQASKDSIDKILEVLPTTKPPHSEILKQICLQRAEANGEEPFLDLLGNDTTEIRAAVADILSRSKKLNTTKLFKRLHETDAYKDELIAILASRAEQLNPEQVINNAIKLEPGHAEMLLKLTETTRQNVDLAMIRLDPGTIENPALKFILLRYFAGIRQPEVAVLIGRFLADSNKAVVIEALKSLNQIEVKFDPTVILPFVQSLSGIEREMALETICKQADAEIVSHLAPWSSGKSDEIREVMIKLVVKFATEESLEKYLRQLNLQEWWGKEQALKGLQQFGDDRFFAVAQGLVNHSDEFIKSTAQQLAALQTDLDDITSYGETALHENWQVREQAIAAIGSSGNKDALPMMKAVIQQRPESAVAVLKALTQLGLTKGLEIAFSCLHMPEALVQRKALETIDKLVTEKFAGEVRGEILKRVPKLQVTVRDTAEQVVNRITADFGLSALNITDKNFFGTSLIALEQSQYENKDSSAVEQADSTEVVSFQNIEELRPGDMWMDRYRVKQEIGRGAMGRVMLAEDEMVGEPLILKFMHPELTADGGARERFLRELKYARLVSHNNVIRIHDFLFKDNLCAISMEYFESRGIDDLLKEVTFLEARPGLEILYQVSDGMAAAHKQKVIHRDLKPSNILIDDKGLVKVVDFGIASASSETDATLTKTGSIIGTPAYISPERARGQEADYRCDIYALGIIAYYLFTGKLPYKGEAMAVLLQHIEGKAKLVHEVRETVNPRISLLVQKMMAVDADNRMQTMTEVRDAVKATLDKL